ncbi:hypothetical protein [Helicobacter ganmani]
MEYPLDSLFHLKYGGGGRICALESCLELRISRSNGSSSFG